MGDDQVVRLGHPLVGTGRGLGQLPVVLEQVLKELVGPLGRRLGPGHLKTRGDGVRANASAVSVLPAKTLFFQAGGLGLVADIRIRSRAVSLSKS